MAPTKTKATSAISADHMAAMLRALVGSRAASALPANGNATSVSKVMRAKNERSRGVRLCRKRGAKPAKGIGNYTF